MVIPIPWFQYHNPQTTQCYVPKPATPWGYTGQLGSVMEQELELPLGFALQSGPDGHHVFVRIRNDWSLESKQLRRAITITQHILLPCLLPAFIPQLCSACPGKALIELPTWSF